MAGRMRVRRAGHGEVTMDPGLAIAILTDPSQVDVDASSRDDLEKQP